jgi:hypothetical protein
LGCNWVGQARSLLYFFGFRCLHGLLVVWNVVQPSWLHGGRASWKLALL